MTDRVLIDTGPIVALHRRDDEHHKSCVEVSQHLPNHVYTCWPVITEAAYLLRDRPESVQSLLAECENGRFVLLPLGERDISPIAAILKRYQSHEPQLADAALVHLANRERTRRISRWTVGTLRYFVMRRISHLNCCRNEGTPTVAE